jgi:type I restriction enzyme S subunit
VRNSAYPEYKESGGQWLGEVPRHWDVKRLKTSAKYKVSNVDKVTKEDEVSVRLCNYTDVYYNDHITPEMELMKGTATPEEINRFHLEVDDIVITKDSEDWRDIAVPARVAETAGDLVCGYHLAIVSPDADKLDGRYLLRAFQSCAVNQQFQISASGVTRYGLPKSSIGEAQLPLPPIEEQTAIADFLDLETGRIDTLVAKKRRLIALLKEKRTTLISRTVTRGLPEDAAREFGLEPHIRFKDSGIEWLGEVPVGWDVRPIKRIVSVPVTDGPHETPEILDDGIPFVSAEAIKEGRINFDRIRGYISLDDHIRYSKKYKPRYGDIYMVKSGATTGRVAMVETEEEFNIWSPLAAIRCKSSVADRNYVYFYLQSKEFQKAVELHWSFGTQQNIGMGVIQNLSVPIGATEEQAAIATYLARETARIDHLVEKVEAAIERLQEYRTALITAAVTGKIDVREAAA